MESTRILTKSKLLKIAKRKLRTIKGMKLHQTLICTILRNIEYYVHRESALRNLPVTIQNEILCELSKPCFKDIPDKNRTALAKLAKVKKACARKTFPKTLRVLKCLHWARKIPDRERPITFETFMKAVCILMGPHTTKFWMCGLLSFCKKRNIPQRTEEIIEKIVENAPNLEFLAMRTHIWNKIFSLSTSSLVQVSKLEKLKKLDILSYSVHYKEVTFLCKELKNLNDFILSNLIFNGIEDPSMLGEDIEEFQSCFSRLKNFAFGCSEKPFAEKLVHLCVEHLPSIMMASNFSGVPHSEPCHDGGNMPLVPSALRIATLGESRLDYHTVFPNVTRLKIIWKSNTVMDNFMQYSKVTQLTLIDLPDSSTVNEFLRRYGTGLHRLAIEFRYHPKTLSLKSIFDACPHLENLSLEAVIISDEKEPIEFFAQLKKFQWCPIWAGGPIELCNILAAPNLEQFRLQGFNMLETNDLKRLTSLIAENKILQKLDAFELNRPLYSGNYAEYQELLLALSELVANATAFLPKLDCIVFSLNRQHPCQLKYVWRCKDREIREAGKKFREWAGDGSIAQFLLELEKYKIDLLANKIGRTRTY